jgi:NADH:ubiquinone oxidoreductase subunit E
LFTVDALRCIGACAIAQPSRLMASLANLTVDRVEKIIKEYEGGATDEN